MEVSALSETLLICDYHNHHPSMKLHRDVKVMSIVLSFRNKTSFFGRTNVENKIDILGTHTIQFKSFSLAMFLIIKVRSQLDLES